MCLEEQGLDDPLLRLSHSDSLAVWQSNREVPEWSLLATVKYVSHLDILLKYIFLIWKSRFCHPPPTLSSSEMLTNATVQRYEQGCPNNVSL